MQQLHVGVAALIAYVIVFVAMCSIVMRCAKVIGVNQDKDVPVLQVRACLNMN